MVVVTELLGNNNLDIARMMESLKSTAAMLANLLENADVTFRRTSSLTKRLPSVLPIVADTIRIMLKTGRCRRRSIQL